MAKQRTKDEQVHERIRESAHKIWLAGLGALAAAEQEGGKLFRSLVRKGEQYEEQGRERIEQLRTRVEELSGTARDKAAEVAAQVERGAGSAWQRVGGGIDEAVTSALGKVGVPTRSEINRLTRRIEELTALVEAKAGAPGRSRSAAARPATRKAATGKAASAKSAAGKATRRPAARKSARTSRRSD